VKLTKSRKKEKEEKEQEIEGKKEKRKKKRENQGKQQGEITDDQRANQTAKLLKDGKKKKKITSSGTVEFVLVVLPLLL
jgi:hypothetical protein